MRKALPRHCLVVRTYAELRSLATAFANGAYELMCVLGGPGLGKTETIRRTMQQVLGGDGWAVIKGKHSPFDLYLRLFQFRSVPVVLDDLDDLLRKPDNVTMLKCLCDSTPVKRVEWGSTYGGFKSDLPKSFETVSRACLISNDWNSLDRNIGALHDRGVVLLFQPSTVEIHRELAYAGWFADEEVFEFIGRNLFLITEPSFRFYKTAEAHKKAGLDWRELTLRSIQNMADPQTILVARLLANAEYDAMPSPENARVRAFGEAGAGSRASYFRHKAQLLERRGKFDFSELENIKLAPAKPDLHYLALLDRRNQIEQMSRTHADDSGTACEDEPPENVDEWQADRLTQLTEKLQRAIAAEDYELAAKLRDEIGRMRGDQRDIDR